MRIVIRVLPGGEGMTAPRFALLKSYSFFIFFPFHRRGFSCRYNPAIVAAKRIDNRHYASKKSCPVVTNRDSVGCASSRKVSA